MSVFLGLFNNENVAWPIETEPRAPGRDMLKSGKDWAKVPEIGTLQYAICLAELV